MSRVVAMADRRVVVALGVHEPLVLRGQFRVGLAGLVGGGEEGLAQQWVAGLVSPCWCWACPDWLTLGTSPE